MQGHFADQLSCIPRRTVHRYHPDTIFRPAVIFMVLVIFCVFLIVEIFRRRLCKLGISGSLCYQPPALRRQLFRTVPHLLFKGRDNLFQSDGDLVIDFPDARNFLLQFWMVLLDVVQQVGFKL